MTSPSHPDRDVESLGTGVCGGCGDTTTVYRDDTGLRCASCFTPHVETYPVTYTPSLHDYTDPQHIEMATNVKEFNNSLPDIGFDVELQDGSVYEMDKHDAAAVFMKYGDNWQAFLSALAHEVATHFEKETEPTKYNRYASWGSSNHDDAQREYNTHSELAPIVAYADLRAAKMQLGFIALAGEDEDPVTVLGLDMDADTIHEYSEHGRITVEYGNNDAIEDMHNVDESNSWGDEQ